MDLVLDIADNLFLDRLWATVWPALPRSVAKNPELLAALASGAPPSSGVLSNLTNGIAGWSSALGGSAAATTTQAAVSSVARSAASRAYDAAASVASDVDWEALRNTSALPRDNIVRQTLSLLLITYIGIHILYFTFAGLSFKYLFNKDMMKHPRFLKNQVRLEIESSLRAFLPLDLLTVPWFVLEVRGYSKLYNRIDDYGWAYAILSVPLFLVFTDAAIYWVHRLEHHPRLYKHWHKPHHKWLIPTPFASHAFHPLDGYAQSLPYHIFPFIFPLHRLVSIGLFIFVNLWSILIHDSDMICNSPLEKIINGPSHHTLHHLYFTCNYGQYFTGCDRLGGSYRAPRAEDDPLLAVTGVGEKLQKADAQAPAPKAAVMAESKKSQ